MHANELDSNRWSRIVIVMGVSGAGKTTIGQMMAQRLQCDFADGDDYHSAEARDKMAHDIPLTDEDRQPWLTRLAALLHDYDSRKQGLVLACSALKERYRDALRGAVQDRPGALIWIWLHGSHALLEQRLRARQHHYMKADMLESQLDALEEPSAQEALWVDIDGSVEQVTARSLDTVRRATAA